jgi:hypothetical protein
LPISLDTVSDSLLPKLATNPTCAAQHSMACLSCVDSMCKGKRVAAGHFNKPKRCFVFLHFSGGTTKTEKS